MGGFQAILRRHLFFLHLSHSACVVRNGVVPEKKGSSSSVGGSKRRQVVQCDGRLEHQCPLTTRRDFSQTFLVVYESFTVM
ncbi:hypothetical protein E2C01_086388 [Portunus trituberculatus]|uniref:Secreted protein n=1 Tax=Portunus trituberculatus TaxID=210409 RepID=A0A5B7J951_PORTR|nr:hypothetical protein [Portunus trituberculatus]